MSCMLISLLLFFPVTLKEIFYFGHGRFEKPINHLSRDVEEAAGYISLIELHEITQKKEYR